ncbi:MAG: glycosyltransferase [Steroidobacteraceae bacterium]
MASQLFNLPMQWIFLGGATSFLFSLLLIATKNLHGRLTLDTMAGVHKFHTAPTPRIGGAAIAAGLLVCWMGLRYASTTSPELSTTRELEKLLGLMLLAGSPAFVFGILEDLTKRVGVRARLLATIGSGVLGWWLTNTSITHLDIAGIDTMLTFLPLSVAFTAFATGGVANAFNIIDGFNGLAAGAIAISSTAIGYIAYDVGDMALAQVCIVLVAAVAGFYLLNFPFGKIFLGDGGAYLMGFLVAWTAVLLPMRNPGVSVWAALLACGYPVLEVLFSIVRKYFRVGSTPGQPDRVHLHMLIYQRISRRVFSDLPPSLQNSVTSLFAWLFAAIPAATSIALYKHTPALILGFAASAVLYRIIYLRLTQFKWCLSANKPQPVKLSAPYNKRAQAKVTQLVVRKRATITTENTPRAKIGT